MSFVSRDDIIKKTTGGSANATPQMATIDYHKTGLSAVGTSNYNYMELLTGIGFPCAYPSSTLAGTAIQLNASTVGAFPLVEGVVSPLKRQMMFFGATSTMNGSGASEAFLMDYLIAIPALVVTGTPTVIDNTQTLPRYISGYNVQAFCAVKTTLGAAQPALTFSCTMDDNSTQTFTVTINQTSGVPGQIFLNANGGAFFTDGKQGIKSVNSYTIASGTTGTVNVFLAYTLATLPIGPTQGYVARDTVNQLYSMPQIYDNACLGLMGGSPGVIRQTSYWGQLKYGWA